jgi:hypothetical protein
MFEMVITNAGRQAVVNSAQSGTNKVTIAKVGVGGGKYTPEATQTALKNEIKRLDIVSGGTSGSDSIHVAFVDATGESYSVSEIGLYLDDGTLFAVGSQNAVILTKEASTVARIVIDLKIENLDVSEVSFGDVTFRETAAASADNAGVVSLATGEEVISGDNTSKAVTPAGLKALTATTERAGLAEIATGAEATAGTDSSRVMTPATTKAVFDGRLASNAEAIAGADTSKAVTPAGLAAKMAEAVKSATTTTAGIVPLATATETQTGTESAKAVTPAGLSQRTATDARTGIIEVATEAEAKAGTDTSRAMTPATTKAVFDGRLATSAETQAGTDATKAVTPAGLAARTATTARTGIVELATNAETTTGTDTARAVTPAGTKAALDARFNGVVIDSSSRIINAPDGDKFSLYPSGLSGMHQARAGANQITLARFSNDAPGSSLGFYKSRGATINASKSVLPSDVIGQINFMCDNGNIDYSQTLQGARAAHIEAGVFESSDITSSGTTNIGIRGYLRLYACSDENSRDGKGIEILDNGLRPTVDNNSNLGTAGRRWKAVYAVSDVISTSDESKKQDIADIPDEVLNAWGTVNFKQFHFKEDVTADQDNAKLFCGVIAQTVMAAFTAAGLDACAYGLVCADTDEDGNTVYGVRYREALVLEAAWNRKQLATKAAISHTHEASEITGLESLTTSGGIEEFSDPEKTWTVDDVGKLFRYVGDSDWEKFVKNRLYLGMAVTTKSSSGGGGGTIVTYTLTRTSGSDSYVANAIGTYSLISGTEGSTDAVYKNGNGWYIYFSSANYRWALGPDTSTESFVNMTGIEGDKWTAWDYECNDKLTVSKTETTGTEADSGETVTTYCAVPVDLHQKQLEEGTGSGENAIVYPGRAYALTLSGDTTISAGGGIAGLYGEAHISINPGTYNVTAGDNLTIGGTLTASKVNYCKVVWRGVSARLIIEDVE